MRAPWLGDGETPPTEHVTDHIAGPRLIEDGIGGNVIDG